MRELNEFNKIILQKFSSKQAYTFVKGQYIPIVSTNISDESVTEIDKRKFYIQNYDFTMLGYLIDEEEFEVKPAISRVVQVFETETKNLKKRRESKIENKNKTNLNFYFSSNTSTSSTILEYNMNLTIENVINVKSFDVTINGDFFGSNLNSIQLNCNDEVTISVIKENNDSVSHVNYISVLV